MTSLHLTPAQRQLTGLSPRLQHAVRLLQMSSLEFAQEIRAAMSTNPFLEEDESAAPGEDLEPAPGAALDADAVGAMTADTDGAAAAADGSDSFEFDGVGAEPDDGWVAGDDREFSAAGTGDSGPGSDASAAIERVPHEASLAAQLHGQLHLLHVPTRDLLLAKAIVESLEPDGYLRIDLDELRTELQALCDGDPEVSAEPVSDEEMRIALRRVQSLEPAGVGARNLVECLLLQLRSVEDTALRALMRRIIETQLDSVARKDPAALALQLGLPPAEVQAAVTQIRRLDPRPGWRVGAADVHYIVPDLIVRRGRGGDWNVVLNPAVVPNVRLHQVYAQMYERERRQANPALAAQLRDARWTVRNVEQRFATILGVARAIVARQRAFFEHGPLGMKPLALKAIADEIGIHESTVCRVTNNKYIATPTGVFELKYFFSRVMTTTGGAELSNTAIRRLVREMLEAESERAPLSDAEITRRLAKQGLVLSRRTVTKYRHLMQIEPMGQRRRAAPSAPPDQGAGPEPLAA